MSGSPKMDALRQQREAHAAERQDNAPDKVVKKVVATPPSSSPVVATSAPLPPSVVATCPECAKRRAAKAQAQARFRAKAKDAPGAYGNGAPPC